jgi:hypothetical protein
MPPIKSAMEIALERTKDISSEPDALAKTENQRRGKQLLAEFFHEFQDISKPEKPELAAQKLQQELGKLAKKEKAWAKEGMEQVLLSNIVLPQSLDSLKNIDAVEQGAIILGKDESHIKSLFQQLKQFLNQYLDEKINMRNDLEQQFAPRLRQKEQAYAQQSGQHIQMAADSDPEFQKYLQQGLEQLQQHYEQALTELRSHLKSMLQ